MSLLLSFLYQKRVSKGVLEEFRGKLTGLKDEGERNTLRVVRREDLWREGVGDVRTLNAWALYQGLKKEGKI
jgi:ADP-sugar diphosphatase